MSDRVRGIVVFVVALITIALWVVPFSLSAQARPGGGTLNQLRFGLFAYLTVHSEMREPEFTLSSDLDFGRLGVTAATTIALWGGVVYLFRRTSHLGRNRPQS